MLFRLDGAAGTQNDSADLLLSHGGGAVNLSQWEGSEEVRLVPTAHTVIMLSVCLDVTLLLLDDELTDT